MSQDPQQPLRVSDHAIVRYIERVIGIDTDQIRAAILGPIAGLTAKVGDTGRFPADGFKVVVNKGVVVTVITKQEDKE